MWDDYISSSYYEKLNELAAKLSKIDAYSEDNPYKTLEQFVMEAREAIKGIE